MSLTPKDWHKFQHYKNRDPVWIKLHRKLLSNYDFKRLPIASKALAPLLWLLAAEYDSGTITASADEIAWRVGFTPDEYEEAIKPLMGAGFFIFASNTLATCKHDASLEKEKEKEKEKKDIRAVADATRPPADKKFEEFWEAYPKRQGANPREPARKKFAAAVKSGTSPDEIIAAVGRYAEVEGERVGTVYIAQAVTWLGQKRWGDYPAAATPGRASVFVRENTPQWEAWQALGRTPVKNGGWWFPQEWPQVQKE